MIRIMLLIVATLSMAACISQPGKSNDIHTIHSVDTGGIEDHDQVSQTMCFQKLAGTSNQDTTSLKLIFKGNSVSGNFAHYPKEKDGRVGTIKATKNRDLIKGTWIFMQEGVNDTLQVEFKLEGERLTQKNYTVDPKTGREVFLEGSLFNIEFDNIPCKD